ncbi:STE-like transcription factor [Scheffersomyces stipitis CBS 6054]|uniref:STE-like transcription factor n=1 Tax=Scheffersomyces stipitis (strain ATCC 58785 / CBS 6054 / NBRC 10063 / NRRL Y-11545) TaxID=322104 RepID=A3LWT9_PICST|nr:STE-like transcription factor [Scheffersomyces stipitis CBS 6054]ABN67695.2 STE-like transcription factor [Scheffersomyces stipitis CBS 6054]
MSLVKQESQTSSRDGIKDDNSKPQEDDITESLRLIEDLKFFLATAPANWQENQVIRRYYLNHDEGFVSCVFWNNLYFVTGTDIVRCIVYKFEHFGRTIIDRKKFEEGIFSDLRNLKCGTDAILEPPRSDFLEFLFKNSCLRTQKKQKVFFWFNVPHDKLMADALERDLKKEKAGQNPTTVAQREPAKSFKYDESANLYTQLAEHMEKQKVNNQEIYDHNPPVTTNENDNSSPEYTTSTNVVLPNVEKSNGENYEFLDHETPAQFKANSDYEDDFPLDYFDPNYEDSYITLDPNYQLGGYSSMVDENYDSIVDPSVFIYPTNTSSAPPATTPSFNQVAYNAEYLIEQTQPLKTPLPQMPSAVTLQPKSANFVGFPSATDEFFPTYLPPLSAKYQTGFPRSTPTQIVYPNITQATPEVAYETLPPNHSQSEIYFQQEPEYWPPQSAAYGGSYEVPMHYNQQYVILNEHDYAPNAMYQVVNPSSMPIPPPSAGAYLTHFGFSPQHGAPSFRQQQISANMMKKRSAMAQGKTQGISKPSGARTTKTAHFTVEEIANSKLTRLLNQDNHESARPANDGMMPTPVSSANPSDDKK